MSSIVRYSPWPVLAAPVAALVVVVVIAASSSAFAAKGYEKLDEMAIDRWAKLRETERYQLKIAEKYYLDAVRAYEARQFDVAAGHFTTAAAEYEKFVTLYETSEGAPFVQLKWALCQVKLKKLNTAIKDGFQSVIDYWPDSPEAVAAAYLIGQTYKDMGDIPHAKAAYLKLLDKHGGEMVTILARLDLADIARIEQDRSRQKSLLKELVATAPRTGTAGQRVDEASRTLAVLEWQDGSFAESLAALETSWKEPELAGQIVNLERRAPQPLRQMAAAADSKEQAGKVAGDASDYLLKQQVADPKTDAEKTRNWTLGAYAAEMLTYGGRSADAAQVCEQVLKRFGDDDQLLQQYASVLRSLQRREEMRRVYGRLKDRLQGRHLIAYSYREDGKIDDAIAIYQRLIADDPAGGVKHVPGGWNYQLAQTYEGAGKYKEAIGIYQQCDNFPSNLQQIAECYQRLKQYKEAIGIYTQIVGGYESRAPWALKQIGMMQELDGKPEAAIKTLQQVCKRYPKSNEASEAHQYLNNKYKITVTLGGAKDE